MKFCVWSKILLIFIYLQTILALSKERSKIFENDEISISYRSNEIFNSASLTDTKRQKQFTELKPDDGSSPLRLSKEQFGRFSWYFLLMKGCFTFDGCSIPKEAH